MKQVLHLWQAHQRQGGGQAKENELLQQYCYVAACRPGPVADGVGVAQNSLSGFGACELRKLVDRDYSKLSI